MNKETFQKRVAVIRQYVNWRQVAAKCNFSYNTVRNYLDGTNGEKIEKMEAILLHAETQLRATRNDLNAIIIEKSYSNKKLSRFLNTEFDSDWTLEDNDHEDILFTAPGFTDDPDMDIERSFEYESEDAKNADYKLAMQYIKSIEN